MANHLFQIMLLLAVLGCDNSSFSGDSGKKSSQNENAAQGKGNEVEVERAAKGIIVGGGAAQRVPQFGLLANDLRCGMCHLKVNGDIVSIETVAPFHVGSNAVLAGSWFVAGEFNADQEVSEVLGKDVDVSASTGIIETYTGKFLPKDVDKNGDPDFPKFSADKIKGEMSGRLLSGETYIEGIHNGNLVLEGTATSPIRIGGEILVKGDLVIAGNYRGIGTIYVTGNVYIPRDLLATQTPFPYPEDRNAALQKALASIEAKEDALAIATNRSIIVGDFESHGETDDRSVFAHPRTPADETAAVLGVLEVYDWFPGGKAGFDQLYRPSPIDCRTPIATGGFRNFVTGRSFSRIDAFLYAQNTIGGRGSRNSFAINGGIMADNFHIISAARECPATLHPVHKLPADNSYINYDFRMQRGLFLLKQLRDFF